MRPIFLLAALIAFDNGTSSDQDKAALGTQLAGEESTLATVTIPGTETTPPVDITADEHQLLADIKAAGHDISKLLTDFKAKHITGTAA